ncbi:transferrin receptor protein 2 isoform X1 [Leptodactylus fuscus]|uniref:transferrin receptor protein 2 isoform X1 n=1 Tax=Leptodactylus fuscus TaxID=238119 RepID=UPI003F4EFEC4
MPSQSYSVYRGVEEEDEAELHIAEAPYGAQRSNPKFSKLWISPLYLKVLCGVIVAACIAFILGYVATLHSCTCDTNGGDVASDESSETYDPVESEPVRMDWTELKDQFTKYLLDGEKMEEKIRKFSSSPHPAGSLEDGDLADSILQTFRSYNLDHTWVQSLFSELQFPNSSRPNSLKIVNGSEIIEEISIGDPTVYSPYSASRRAKGGLVFANYGRQEDFQSLSSWQIPVSGSLVIVRVGLISFAEKVFNAERAGAVGVLIYPEEGENPVYGHVHYGTGDPNTPGFPSFNHTQFPPFKSSGLPQILAQPISLSAARSLLGRLSGISVPALWQAKDFVYRGLGPELLTADYKVQLEVTNVAVSTELHNVFGSITGRYEPGDENFLAKTSPLFSNLIETIIKQVDNPRQSKQSIYDYMRMKSSNWKSDVIVPLQKDSSAFAFTAFAGVPALEFSFIEASQSYKFLDTKQDTYDKLNQIVNGRLPSIALSVAQVAGLTLIKLSNEHILPLDYTAYNDVLLKHLVTLQTHYTKLKSRGLSLDWLFSARGDYTRATQRLKKAIAESDIHNEKIIQFFNVRIMRVEFYFLSQYVSAISSPYRHILLGRGEHTLETLLEHLSRDQNDIDDSELRKQIALFTWTLVGAANALSGEVWEVQRSF